MLRRRGGWKETIRDEVHREVGGRREDFGKQQESHG